MDHQYQEKSSRSKESLARNDVKNTLALALLKFQGTTSQRADPLFRILSIMHFGLDKKLKNGHQPVWIWDVCMIVSYILSLRIFVSSIFARCSSLMSIGSSEPPTRNWRSRFNARVGMAAPNTAAAVVTPKLGWYDRISPKCLRWSLRLIEMQFSKQNGHPGLKRKLRRNVPLEEPCNKKPDT